MIKKLFSKTFYTLFFSTSLMIGSVDALGADKPIAIEAGSTCTTSGSCAGISAATCPSPDLIIMTGTGNIVKKIPYCDDAGAAVLATDLQNTCVFYCNSIVNQIKGNVGDEKYSINQNTFTKSLCNALRIASGSAGKTFAAFAIIATGIGFFTGKVSWGLMIGVTAGIATMFGAPSIVAAISGQDTKTSCNLN
jgi:type IV secretory pathway VirB2 component (pilin)